MRTKKTVATMPPVMLTPRQIAERYGISKPALSRYCADTDPARRLPSTKLPGRNGRRGKVLIRVADLEAWLAKFSTPSTQ